MAISEAGMAAAILAALNGAAPIATPAQLASALAAGIVPYLKANVEVLPGDPPPDGLTYLNSLSAPTPVTGKGKIA